MDEGCKGCARLLKIINDRTKFCTTESGVLYFVDDDWYKKNDCKNKVNEFCLKSN